VDGLALLLELSRIVEEAVSAHEKAARIKALVDRTEREFKRLGEAGKGIDATISPHKKPDTDIERGLDNFLILSGVNSKAVRARMRAALVPLIKRARSRRNIQPSLDALTAVELEEQRQKLPLPDDAPKLYAERPDKSQNIIEFLRDPEGWWPWIKAHVLCKSDIRQRDPQAYQALLNWLQRNEMPPDMEIPTKRELVDRMVGTGAIPLSQAQRVGRSLSHRKAQGTKGTSVQ
jgi:hypothetical protein